MGVRVLIAGGGTAGHVYPGLALAATLQERGHVVSFAGTEGGLEAALVPAAGIDFQAIRARPLPRKLSPALMAAPVAALRAVRQCRPLVRGADAVVGLGGYVSVPAVLAARRESVPVVLHEQNAVPGLANRALSRLATAVALSFHEAGRSLSRRPRLVLTGNPVRDEILRLARDRDTAAKEGMEELDLEPGRRTILVFGGSQGALRLDRAAVGACALLRARSDLQVVVITGPAHLATMERALRNQPEGLLVRLFGYLDRIERAYACADLVACRAGAMTIAEITVAGLPSLLVPYPYATGRHQEANARALQRAGGASVMADEHLSADHLAERILSLIDHQERLRAMAARSLSFGRPDAAIALADLVTEVAGAR